MARAADVGARCVTAAWALERLPVAIHQLGVGFGFITERYTSLVTLEPARRVTAESTQTNLFESLRSEWRFLPASGDPNACWVTFQIDFQFKSEIYNRLSDLFLEEVVANMVKAFEGQCKKVYRH